MKKVIRKKINYDSIADYYILRKNDLPNNIDKLLNIDFLNKNVLDIGCGTGNFTFNLNKMGANIIGIDKSKELLKKAKFNNYGNKISYINCNAEILPFENNSFDIVTVLSAWHWFNRDKVNNEVWRVLKDGGYLIVMNIDCLKSNENGIERESFNMLKRYCNIYYARNGCNKKKFSNKIYPEIWYKEWENKGFIIIRNENYSYNINFNHESWKNYIKSSSYYSTLTFIDKQKFDDELDLLINEYDNIFEVEHNLSIVILKKL